MKSLVFVITVTLANTVFASYPAGYGMVRRGRDPVVRIVGALEALKYADLSKLPESEVLQIKRMVVDMTEELRLIRSARHHEMLLEIIDAQNTHKDYLNVDGRWDFNGRWQEQSSSYDYNQYQYQPR